jgi:hypothetical protein
MSRCVAHDSFQSLIEDAKECFGSALDNLTHCDAEKKEQLR